MNPLVAASACANCHNAPNAEIHAADPIYAPVHTWQSSMMGNSARDPVFWAAVAIASQDATDMGGGIDNGETALCVRCHAPRAFLEGRGYATAVTDLQANDRAGVECELCHRMQVDQGSGQAIGNAQYTIDDIVVGSNVPRRGPWAWDNGDTSQPPHSWLNDPMMGSSALCGTCHDVTTPRSRLDDAGNPIGLLFNEQRTYSEWARSVYATAGNMAASCQDCHMPAVDDMAACVANTNMVSHPTGGRRHELAGANWFMMDVLDHLYGDGGSNEVPSASYEQTQQAIGAVLATAATLEITPPDGVDLGAGLLDFGVRVTNNTGHKLPTGYSEGRLMWLELTARYGETIVFESGTAEQLVGNVPDPLLRTYRAIAEQFSSGSQNHLLLSDHWIEDTRIPPLGMTQSAETDPIGRYDVLPDGNWPNYDDYVYDFDGAPDIVDMTPDDPEDNDILHVQVRLLYVVNTPEYMEFLADTNMTNDAGLSIAALFEELGGSPRLELAVANVDIPITSFGPIDATSSGGESSSDSGSASGSADTSGSASATSSATTANPTTTTASSDGSESTSSGEGGAAEDGGGCGCTTDATPTSAAFALVALLLRRRRR
ncbi:MAG TPA: MYXO-CTERM sorting domain-containing protein [Nannocystaceae bacterium]|nr:MYXO-CTERM sorting domain-containing protein [Nannocystaceae bacterium]